MRRGGILEGAELQGEQLFSSSLDPRSARCLRASGNLSRVSALLVWCCFLFLLTSSSLKVQVLSKAWKPAPFSLSRPSRLSLPEASLCASVSSSVGQRWTRTSPEVPFAIPALGKLMAGPGWVNVAGKSCSPRRHRGRHLAQVMSGTVGFQGNVSPRAEQRLPRVDVVLLRTWSAHLGRPSHHSGAQESAYSQLWLVIPSLLG